MGDKTDATLKAGVAPFLQPDEPIVATLFAQPRGRSQAMAGGVAGMVGGKRSGNARRDAEAAGITLAGVMAFVLTPTRLLMVETGNGGQVKGLLNTFPLSDVGDMEVKRLGLGASVTMTILGSSVKLESRVGASRVFAEQLAQVQAA